MRSLLVRLRHNKAHRHHANGTLFVILGSGIEHALLGQTPECTGRGYSSRGMLYTHWYILHKRHTHRWLLKLKQFSKLSHLVFIQDIATFYDAMNVVYFHLTPFYHRNSLPLQERRTTIAPRTVL